MTSPAQILVVEDDPLMAGQMQDMLLDLGYNVAGISSSGEDAVRQAMKTKPDLVLMDIVLKGALDGVRAAEQIRACFNIPVVYVSGYIDEKTLQHAKITEPYAYILKPVDKRELHTNIEIALYRHQMETTLRESQRWFAAALSSIGDAVIATDGNGGVTFMNPAAELLTGWRQHDVVGKTVPEILVLIHEQTLLPAENPVTAALRGGEVVVPANHSVLIARGGQRLPVETSAAPIKDDKGNTIGVVLVIRSITDQRLAAEEMRQALEKAMEEKAKTEAVIEAIGDGLSILDTNYRLLYQNKTARDMLGTHVGEYCYEVYEKRDRVCYQCPVALSFADGNVHIVERSNDARTLHLEITASPIKDANGRVIGGIEVTRDITTRKLGEIALKESEERYRDLFENAHDLIQSVSPEGRFVFVNKAWMETLGYTVEDIRTITMFDILDPACLDHCLSTFQRVMAGEVEDNIEAVFIAKDKRKVYVEGNVNVRYVDGKVIATQGIFRDVTERKRTEEEKARLEHQLRHAQKIEAVGTLTAGISHEFNNILTAIIGYGEFLQEGIDKDSPLRVYADMIQSSALRAASLTQGLLAYSRKQVLKPRPVRLNEIVRNVTKLLSRLIRESIELKSIVPDEDVIIMADPGQLEQVLMNLATNARDAMPHGGSLTIATGCVELGEAFISRHHYGKPGTYALISVSDTGIGMDEKTIERIFEPFFTTKEPGKGTGLGLAVVYGIIKQHKGYITADSSAGKGTLFSIYLPLANAVTEETEPASTLPVQRGAETILVAEDDATVRKLVQDTLEKTGYRVIVAENGEEAVNRFKDSRDEIQFLLFDVIMPKKSGMMAYREIRDMKPDIKVLFMSGYAPDLISKEGDIEEGVNVILKPVSSKELLPRIRELIDR
ncbi:MAG: PAS domain S-box protein [Nitrospirae bacterium]|nr:PAS domain S-box protein [Nitrospirota bacterium]